MNLIGDRLTQAGFDRLRFDTEAFCKNFFDAGGSLDLWNEIGAKTAERMAESASLAVSRDHTSIADLRQPVSEPGGHSSSEDQMYIAPSARETIRDAEGHESVDVQTNSASSIPEPIAGSGGQCLADAQLLIAPAVQQPIPGEAGHSLCEDQATSARPVREPHSDPAGQNSVGNRAVIARGDRNPPIGIGHNRPPPNPPRRLIDLQRTKEIVKPSIFDTCSIRGESLARMSRGRLKKMRFENLFEASLATLIINFAEAPDETLVPDIIDGNALKKMILEAQEIANAA